MIDEETEAWGSLESKGIDAGLLSLPVAPRDLLVKSRLKKVHCLVLAGCQALC